MKSLIPVLELKAVTVAAQKGNILEKLSLKIKKGEFLTILGPNGSGKTTLIKTILGLNKLKHGTINYLNENLKDGVLKEFRSKTGYVPQYLSFDNNFPATAGDVISMGYDNKRAIKWAAEMGISHFLHKKFSQLSGGEKQKVLLSMALSREPQILILDEPDLNLDIKAQKKFNILIEKIWKKTGMVVIYVTHFLNRIPKCSTSIAVVKNGKIILHGYPNVIMKKKNIEELIYG